MNYKYKIKFSNYNEEKNIYYIVISTYLGEFDAICKLHEEDFDIKSNFFGYMIAEMRAYNKYLKRQKYIIKQQYNILSDLNYELQQMKNYNKDCLEARKLRKKMYEKKEEMQKINKIINTVSNNIINEINNYRTNLKKSLELLEEKKKKRIESSE